MILGSLVMTIAAILHLGVTYYIHRRLLKLEKAKPVITGKVFSGSPDEILAEIEAMGEQPPPEILAMLKGEILQRKFSVEPSGATKGCDCPACKAKRSLSVVRNENLNGLH